MKKFIYFFFLLTFISVAAAAPQLSSPSEIIMTFPQETATTAFSLTNTGDSNLTNVTIVRFTQFSLRFSEDNGTFFDSITIGSIPQGQSKIVYAQATLPQGQLTNGTIGTATITSAQNTTNTIVFRPTVAGKLRISKVELDVNKKTKKPNAGETLTNIDAGSDLDFKVEVESLFTANESVNINDVVIEVTIEDIDDSNNLEEDGTINRLRPLEKEDVSFDLTIPLEANEGTYTVSVRAYGTDSNNIRHETLFIFHIKVDKKNHDVRIYRSSLSKDTLSCDRSTTITTIVKNYGRSDEDEVVLTVENSPLGIRYKEIDIELDDDSFDEDSEFRLTRIITINDDVPAGEYPIHITVYRDTDRKQDSTTLPLRVIDCFRPQTIAPLPDLPPQAVVTQPLAVEKPEEEYASLLPLAGIILVFGMIVFLILALVVIAKRNRTYYHKKYTK